MVQDKGELRIEHTQYNDFYLSLDYNSSIDNIVKVKGYNSNYEEIQKLNLIKSESGNYYYFTDGLDLDVSYLKVFVGESYE